MKKILSILVLLNITAFMVFGTNYGGQYSSDLTITAGTHYVTSTLTMRNNSTLTINPGVNLIVQADIIIPGGNSIQITSSSGYATNLYFGVNAGGGGWTKTGINCSGTFTAQGNSTDRILFTDASGGSNGWSGVFLDQITSTATINNCDFSYASKAKSSFYTVGSTTECGGALLLYIPAASVNISECTFDNNIASAGGAIFIHSDGSGNTNIEKCAFSNNTAIDGGAIYFYFSDNITIELCELYYNLAEEDGGAIYIDGNSDNDVILNCLIDNNEAYSEGGGLYIDDVIAHIYSCTITENAGSGGGAFYNYTNNDPYFENTIIYNNGPQQVVPNPDNNHSVYDYCCIEGIATWSNNINSDPEFVDPTNRDFRISQRYGTSCEDVGNPLTPTYISAVDLKGDTRIYLTPPPNSTGRLDIGAYEYENPATQYKLTGETIEDISTALSIFPNPSTEYLIINTNSEEMQQLNISIYNILGEIILNKKEFLIEGENQLILHTKNIMPGNYILLLNFDAGETIKRKIVIE